MSSNKIIISIAAILIFTGCKKEFFNQEPYNSLPLNEAIKSEADLNTAANGMYSSLRSVNLYGRTLIVKGDLMADDVYLKPTNSGRYLWARDYNQTAANGDMEGAWNSAYSAIKNANTVINADLPSSTIVDELKGEAYAVRGLMHFELVKHFAKPYTVDPGALGVPIVTSFNQNAMPARNTLQEVYTQIIADLNQAFTLMTRNAGESFKIISTNYTRVKNSSHMSKYTAKALLARVYQHMGNWEGAREAALDVINNSGFSLVEPGSFAAYWKSPAFRTDRVETLFEVSTDIAGNLGTNSLSAFYDAFGGGYGDVWVTTEHFEQYSATDVRTQVIGVSTTLSPGNTVYTIYKYQNNTNAVDKDDTKVIRFADVVLILAEAYANLGDDANARLWLNVLAQKRDPAFTGYVSSGDELKADILQERRKEFAFEGMRFFDLTRLNLPIPNHTISQFPTVLLPIDANENRRVNAIPQSEIDANPNIRNQQNEGY